MKITTLGALAAVALLAACAHKPAETGANTGTGGAPPVAAGIPPGSQ